MRYVRPFELGNLKPGEASNWLIAPEEEAGCCLRLRRGGVETVPTQASAERFALVLKGTATCAGGEGAAPVRTGSLVFIPAGKSGAVSGDADTWWIEVAASAPDGAGEARVIDIDPLRFEGKGFAHQSLADRTTGAGSMRINVLQVQPGAGSPDFHIHAFAQMYVILEGEMTIDIGKARVRAPQNSIVVLPPGVVHRNFNASSGLERHISLLVPEPEPGQIFDFAIDIHSGEAQLLEKIPETV